LATSVTATSVTEDGGPILYIVAGASPDVGSVDSSWVANIDNVTYNIRSNVQAGEGYWAVTLDTTTSFPYGVQVTFTRPDTTKHWFHGADGGLVFPDQTTQTTAYPGFGSAAIGDTVPAFGNGALWFNSEEGRTYIKYNNQWVDASPTVIAKPLDTSILTNGDNTVELTNAGYLLINNIAQDSDILVGSIKDKDDVLWARGATTEYLGLWFGGNSNIGQQGYGPKVAISVGNKTNDDMYIDADNSGQSNVNWPDGPQANIDVVDKNWHFGADGKMTLPSGGTIENLVIDGGNAGSWLDPV
jgi:hypothetical protein